LELQTFGVLASHNRSFISPRIALTNEWWRRLDTVSQAASRIPGISVERFVPDIANQVPHVRMVLDSNRIKATAREITQQLRKDTPSIVLATSEHGRRISSR
jgi:hypothetical protein